MQTKYTPPCSACDKFSARSHARQHLFQKKNNLAWLINPILNPQNEDPGRALCWCMRNTRWVVYSILGTWGPSIIWQSFLYTPCPLPTHFCLRILIRKPTEMKQHFCQCDSSKVFVQLVMSTLYKVTINTYRIKNFYLLFIYFQHANSHQHPW